MADKTTKLNIVIDAQNKTAAGFAALKKQLDVTQVSVAGVSSAMKSVGIVGTAALTGLSGFIATSVRSYGEAQLAMAKVDATLRAMGKSADGSKEKILQAAAGAVRLGFDDEAAAVSITKLYQRTGDLTEAINLNNLAMDLSRAKSVDLESASRMIALVMSGNARALKEYGIELSDTLTPAQALIELQKMVAGQAEASTGSLTTQMQALHETFSNLQDEIGARFAPMLTEIINQMIPLIDKFTAWTAANPELAKTLLIAAAALLLVTAVMLPLGMALPGIVLAVTALSGAFGALAVAVGTTSLPLLGILALLTIIGVTAFKIANQWQDAWDVIVIAVAESANVLQGIIEGVVNFYVDALNGLIKTVNNLLSKLSAIPMIGDKFKKLSLPTIDPLKIERYDTGAVYNGIMNRPAGTGTLGDTVVQITGNTFLDQDTAEHIGDLIIGKLKKQASF